MTRTPQEPAAPDETRRWEQHSVVRNQRALEAMAVAARRARGPTRQMSSGSGSVPGEFFDSVDPQPDGGEHAGKGGPRLLRAFVIAAALVLVLLLATLAGVQAGGQPGSSGAAGSHGTPTPRSGSSGAPSARTTPSTATPASHQPATTVPAPATPSPSTLPRLDTLTPNQGVAGQPVSIAGANLYSTNGQVVVSFGGQTAPTSCASETSCTAVIPPQSGGTSNVAVTITTSQGTSNPVTFQYQSGAISTVGDGHPRGSPHHGDGQDSGN